MSEEAGRLIVEHGRRAPVLDETLRQERVAAAADEVDKRVASIGGIIVGRAREQQACVDALLKRADAIAEACGPGNRCEPPPDETTEPGAEIES